MDRALGERELLITWLNRGTLHLVRREDYPWLHALTAPPLATVVRRRLAQDGVSPVAADRAVGVIERALADEGPLTREQLRDRVARASVRTEGQALIHLLFLASQRGLVVRGPMAGRQHAYVLVCDWLGESPPVDRDVALAELARRYLAGHGPASDRDLAKWAGLPLRDVRAGLAAISRSVVDRGDNLISLKRRRRAADLPPPRLLGAFDPILMGWTSREPITGEHDSRVVAGGLFYPFVLVEGRAAGTWRLRRGQVELEPTQELEPAVAAVLEADAADVARFLGAAA